MSKREIEFTFIARIEDADCSRLFHDIPSFVAKHNGEWAGSSSELLEYKLEREEAERNRSKFSSPESFWIVVYLIFGFLSYPFIRLYEAIFKSKNEATEHLRGDGRVRQCEGCSRAE